MPKIGLSRKSGNGPALNAVARMAFPKPVANEVADGFVAPTSTTAEALLLATPPPLPGCLHIEELHLLAFVALGVFCHDLVVEDFACLQALFCLAKATPVWALHVGLQVVRVHRTC
eukprot:CAMPEP_0178419694 /NCGR_PEP_ID=MMETSP0689_2-20121128/25743_1 /TAXON_ID=160604 /ORGANISM="Amphidinium massartii, Strain CS-259" /LENGTH=115 /DNA_ID=CAMNT_0020041141 /DNA_START=419 /DNA_END=765 /DNA_ORIENTATION=-